MAIVQVLLDLDDDALASVLGAAQRIRVLGRFASTCHRLCFVARSRLVPEFWITDSAGAAMFAKCGHTFTGCRKLFLEANDDDVCSLVPAVLAAAAKLSDLNDLGLTLYPDVTAASPQLEHFDRRVSELLKGLPELQQVDDLYLDAAVFGPSTAACIGALPNLTRLV
jgi:hypothetical protein